MAQDKDDFDRVLKQAVSAVMTKYGLSGKEADILVGMAVGRLGTEEPTLIQILLAIEEILSKGTSLIAKAAVSLMSDADTTAEQLLAEAQRLVDELKIEDDYDCSP